MRACYRVARLHSLCVFACKYDMCAACLCMSLSTFTIARHLTRLNARISSASTINDNNTRKIPVHTLACGDYHCAALTKDRQVPYKLIHVLVTYIFQTVVGVVAYNQEHTPCIYV
jgi:hypothetical protein